MDNGETYIYYALEGETTGGWVPADCYRIREPILEAAVTKMRNCTPSMRDNGFSNLRVVCVSETRRPTAYRTAPETGLARGMRLMEEGLK